MDNEAVDLPLARVNGDWYAASPAGWASEIFVRLALGTVLAISHFCLEPFNRYVEPNLWHHYNYPYHEIDTVTESALFSSLVIVPIFLVCTAIAYSAFYPDSGWKNKYTDKVRGKSSFKSKDFQHRVWSEILVALLTMTMAFLCTGVITDVTKNIYGRPRPDFLSRCYGPKNITSLPGYWVTLPSRNPLRAKSITANQQEALTLYGNSSATPHTPYENKNEIKFPYIEDVKAQIPFENCVNDNSKLITYGRRSFPSGHSSFAFAGAMLCALYSGYWLGNWKTKLNIKVNGTSRPKLPGASAKVAILVLFHVPAIYVAVSRTQDYRHHSTDVIGGALIGSVVTFITFFQYYSFSSFIN